jgi:DNA/RNA-binding domain of Phe-tRNA-synthetase-like protein
MSQQLLTIRDIAMLLNMPYGRLIKVLHRVEGFPSPVDKKGLYRVYERAAVEAFDQQYHLADQINDCFVKYYQQRYLEQKAKSGKSTLNNALAVRFLRGDYAPKLDHIADKP